MTIPIGIDLGTTISVVAVVDDDGSIRVLPNELGETLTPSVVYFEGGNSVLVGRDAKRMGPMEPDRVVSAIKRQMGQDATLRFDGVEYRPEAVSAIILRALVEAAAKELGVAVDELVAVVTVPAYFGAAEREATAAAARIASLDCRDLVAEPVAAALAYGISSDQRGTVLVYDLGGGTFDATVVELLPTGPRVVAVDGASHLGGLNFDERLAALLLTRYVAAASDEKALDDEEFVLALAAQAEDVKKTLSRTDSATALIQHGGRRGRIVVRREEFEQATSDLMTESLDVVERVIATASGLGAKRPGEILLIGGATRMPMISAGLEARFGVPVRSGDVDTAVARGAAVHARALVSAPRPPAGGIVVSSLDRALTSSPVRSVVSRALGIKLHDSHDPNGTRIFVEHVIPANSPLPVEGVTATFATVVDGQDRVRIELMEQAGSIAAPDLNANRRVLDGELTGMPEGLPAGSPIDVCVSVGLDGRIECVATERGTGRELTIESFMEGVADSGETEQQRRAVSGLMVRG